MKKLALAALALGVCLASCTGSKSGYVPGTPTMGWSSWNTYSVNISDSLIMSQADAMVSTGLKDAGYSYINIDDGYFGGRDKVTGQLLIHPTRFPKGMKAVVDHIHAQGLKAGIYSDAGYNTCGNYWNKDTIANCVGLYGHDKQDAEFFFNKLGFDFIKVDFCGGTAWQNHQMLSLDPRERYTAIHEAILSTGRKDVRLNVCRWDYPGTWVSDVATSWRMSSDISSRWSSVKNIIQQNLYLSAYAFDGHFNDMDMLEVGRTLSEEEDRTHFGMWCMMCSPLLIGCDMTTIKPEALALLKNKNLIALDQDPLMLQAYVVRHDGDTYVLVKDILERESVTRAVALYNPTDEATIVSVGLEDLCLGGSTKVRDLYSGEYEADITDGMLSREVPAHGLRIYSLEAAVRSERRMYEAETAYLSDYQELYNHNVVGSGYYRPEENASGGMLAANLGCGPTNDLQWRNVYSKEGGNYRLTFRFLPAGRGRFYVAVGEQDSKRIDFLPSEEYTEASVDVVLQKGDNRIRLFNDRDRMPDMDYMTVEAL